MQIAILILHSGFLFLPFGLQYSFYCQALREMANYSEICICIYLLLIEYGVVVL